jgi:vacuolar-type H+-ATPase subunit H
MAMEELKKIHEAEKKAQAIVKAANQKAHDMIDDANDSAFKIRERATIEAEAKYENIIEEATKSAKAEVDGKQEDIRRHARQIRHMAHKKIEAVSDYVLERIVDNHGNR